MFVKQNLVTLIHSKTENHTQVHINEKTIIDAWQKNGKQWIRTIEKEEITSRKASTNEAIINVIMNTKPQSILDLGCGEGWINRSLMDTEIDYTGIDGVKELIKYAKLNSDGNYVLATYEDLIHEKIIIKKKFDSIIFNYALFGKENTKDMLDYSKKLLNIDGQVIIQTIHPENESIPQNHESKWITENWTGCAADYHPFNWYFRIQEDWIKLFNQIDLIVFEEQDIYLPDKLKPFSKIFVLKKMVDIEAKRDIRFT